MRMTTARLGQVSIPDNTPPPPKRLAWGGYEYKIAREVDLPPLPGEDSRESVKIPARWRLAPVSFLEMRGITRDTFGRLSQEAQADLLSGASLQLWRAVNHAYRLYIAHSFTGECKHCPPPTPPKDPANPEAIPPWKGTLLDVDTCAVGRMAVRALSRFDVAPPGRPDQAFDPPPWIRPPDELTK